MYDDLIEVGMTFTIEPMLNLGTHEWEMWDDNWTVVTKDGRRSAQFEHTLLVTPDRRRGADPPLTVSAQLRRNDSARSDAPILFLRMGWPGDRVDPQGSPRKVRAPQGKVVGNTHPGQPAGKCHRKQTATSAPAGAVRVKRWCKRPPAFRATGTAR